MVARRSDGGMSSAAAVRTHHGRTAAMVPNGRLGGAVVANDRLRITASAAMAATSASTTRAGIGACAQNKADRNDDRAGCRHCQRLDLHHWLSPLEFGRFRHPVTKGKNGPHAVMNATEYRFALLPRRSSPKTLPNGNLFDLEQGERNWTPVHSWRKKVFRFKNDGDNRRRRAVMIAIAERAGSGPEAAFAGWRKANGSNPPALLAVSFPAVRPSAARLEAILEACPDALVAGA